MTTPVTTSPDPDAGPLTRLSQENLGTLSVPVPGYDRSAVTTGIVHFGVGGFHRSHQAMYLDRLMSQGQALDWGICGVGVLPADRAMAEVLAAQDCLFTLLVKHPDGSLDARVIGSIVEYLFAPDDPEAVVARMADPATRIVSLTVTEGGYNASAVTGEFDGTNPAVAGRVRSVKGGAVLKERPFLAHLRVSVWIPEPDGSRIAEALRRPVWPIRLGRSQDLVHLRSVRPVRLEPAGHAVVGHALAPPGAHPAGTAITVRLTRFISTDRLRSTYGDYLWCPEPAGRMPVVGAFHDGGHAVWLDPDPVR